jgi:peroxiredoxin
MVDLAPFLGREPVVLLFFPLAFSSVCTAEMCHMRDTWERWQSVGAKVFGISVDSPFVTDRFRDAEKIPFPILSDFNKEVSAKYGALHAELMGLRGVSKRAAFVIGRDGLIKFAWISEDPGKQVPFDEVLAALASA